ncbi:MAG: H-type small acid-soluble spore protein [Methylocystaceae bacterium]
MLAKRAQEIMESHGVIEVHYQGQSVWLEELMEDAAMISFLDNSDRKMQVGLGDLIEQ